MSSGGLDYGDISEGRLLALKLLLGALLSLVLGISLSQWVRVRREDRALREGILPACVARLDNEATCRQHLEAFHDDCARLTRTRPPKGSRADSHINPPAYLECIVLGVDPWVEAKGQLHRVQQDQLHRDLTP